MLKNKLLLKIQLEKRVSRDNLRQYGKSLNYDMATVDRQLRRLTNEKKIEPAFNRRYIKEYRIVPEQVTVKVKDLGRESLNDKLRIILKQIKPSWDNYKQIDEIQKALCHSSEYSKQIIIKKNVKYLSPFYEK